MPRLFALIVCLGMLAPLPARAQLPPVPGDGDIKLRYATELPALWLLQEFVVDAAVNYGTPVEPLWKRRYSAKIALRGDSFAEAGREGPVIFLQRVGKAGDTRVEYGIVSSQFKLGRWTVEIEPDVDPKANAGRLREAFGGRTVVKGTPDETAHFADMEAERERRHKASLVEAQRKAEAEAQRLKQAEQDEQALRTQTMAMQRRFDDDIRARVAALLPPPWTLSSFRPVQTAVDGLGDKAVFAIRFAAEAKTERETYRAADREGGVLYVTLLQPAGAKKELGGLASVRRDGPVWRIVLALDNADAVRDGGRTLDQFPGRVIVRGSAAEVEYRREQDAARAAAHAAELAEAKRVEETREAARKAELARIAHAEKMEEERRKQRERAEAAALAAKQQKLAALQAAFADTNNARKVAAATNALASDDPQLQTLALLLLAAHNKVFSGGSRWSDYPFEALVLRLTAVNVQTGEVRGFFVGGKLYDESEFTGNITGASITVANKQCHLTAKLTEKRVLQGTFSGCKYNSPHEVVLNPH